MKTLEDIIEALENCLIDPCPDCIMYINNECQKDKYALKYLKEYQLQKDNYQEAIRNCEEAENKYKMLSGKLDGFPTADIRKNLRY